MTEENSLPEPHENVRGVDRTRDDLLSLDVPALKRRVIMLHLANQLWNTTMGATGTPRGQAAYERMTEPKVGDLVVESVAMCFPSVDDPERGPRSTHGFGILLGVRAEWTSSNEEWQKRLAKSQGWKRPLRPEDRPMVTAQYVQYGPKATDVVRWVDATLFALPSGMLYHTREENPPAPELGIPGEIPHPADGGDS